MADLKVHYLKGNSDDFPALYKEIAEWLKQAKVVKYQLNSTAHYHAEEQRWHILITVMYQDGVVSPIATPLIVPRRAD